jgi:hypothetical protein
MDINPFKIAISEKELKDLQNRINNTRWPGEVFGEGGSAACRWITSKS